MRCSTHTAMGAYSGLELHRRTGGNDGSGRREGPRRNGQRQRPSQGSRAPMSGALRGGRPAPASARYHLQRAPPAGRPPPAQHAHDPHPTAAIRSPAAPGPRPSGRCHPFCRQAPPTAPPLTPFRELQPRPAASRRPPAAPERADDAPSVTAAAPNSWEPRPRLLPPPQPRPEPGRPSNHRHSQVLAAAAGSQLRQGGGGEGKRFTSRRGELERRAARGIAISVPR